MIDDINLVNALVELNTTTTKKDKQSVLLKYQDLPQFKDAVIFLLNSFDMVGISTKKIQKDVAPVLVAHTFSELASYLRKHPTGSNDDIAVVRGYLAQFGEHEKDVLSRLIAKTLTLGVSADSINKAYGEGTIPTFSVQLAFPYAKKIDSYSDTDEFYVTQKLDGHRALTTVTPVDDRIQIITFTRRGQQVDGLTELHKDILTFIQQNADVMANFTDGFAIDGELLLKNPDNLTTAELFQATSKVLRRDGEKTDVTYNVFDLLPLHEFLYQKASSADYTTRREDWLNHLSSSELISVIPVLAKITKDEIPTWSNYATAHEWEGVMLNYAKGLYRKTRSPQLLKVKKMHTADLEIVGYNTAISGKFEGLLSSINVKLDDENIVQVGSGLTEEVRDEIWKNKDKYLGVMVEIQYFEITENEQGGKSLRFPVFKDFRFDKTPADANIE